MKPRISQWSCPRPLQDTPHILLAHGGGGKLTADLFKYLIWPALENPILREQTDAAVLPIQSGRLAFTTDSYVVRPLFFPGGSIGNLAVHGTLNDLAMMGAVPKYLSLSLILEEGLPIADLAEILQHIGEAARQSGVLVVTGDTKVIERSRGDGCFINTSGIGIIPEGCDLGSDQIRVGDVIVLNGTLADHGLAVLSQREGLRFDSEIRSDTAPLHELVQRLLAAVPVRMLRDPTRGGLATTLNEIALATRLGLTIWEEAIPMNPAVQAACELLGLDPLTIANEGKLIAVIPKEFSTQAIAILAKHPFGERSAVIGEVVAEHPGYVAARTSFGVEKMIPMPTGDLLPRIC